MPDFQHREMEHPIREDGDGRGGESEPVEDYSDAVDTIEVLDPADIRISTKHPTVEIVVDRLRSDNILVTPRFPMGGDVRQLQVRSRLIESLLLKMPLPVFHMVANPYDNWTVVDGLWRLGALRDFVVDRTLRLRGLEYMVGLEGNFFDELTHSMRRRLLNAQLARHVIEPSTPRTVTDNIRRRILSLTALAEDR